MDRAGPGRHAMSTEVNAHEHLAGTFARELAALIDAGRSDNRFRDVVLVAEPRFLGLLRGALGGVSASRVSATVAKDLAHVEVRDLGRHLEPVLAV
jgi:protein required for attachment to host cells